MRDYKTEILFIDISKDVVNQFRTENFIVNTGTLGNPYPVAKETSRRCIECGLNHDLEYLVEQDIVIINTETIKTLESNPLIGKQWKQSSKCSFVPNDSDVIFYPQYISGTIYHDEISELLNRGKVVIAFGGSIARQSSKLYEFNDGQLTYKTDVEESNYSFIFGSQWDNTAININKGKRVVFDNTIMLSTILKGCENDISFFVKFNVWENKHLFAICKDESDNIIGYCEVFEGKSRGILIVLPQFSDLSKPIKNILFEFLPNLKPDLLPGLVKNSWLNSDEYLLPDIKNKYYELELLKAEYDKKIMILETDIEEKKKVNTFFTDILCSDGFGNKLEENIKKVLEYLGFENVVAMDGEIGDENRQEDLQIVLDSEIMLIEIKGHNGMPSEDDCQAILKYMNRNMRKHRKKDIYGVLIVNHNKNLEPKKRTYPAFSKEQIEDALRDEYCLVSTWELYQMVRLYQTNLITFEEISKEFHTAGLFCAIPRTWTNIGKIEKLFKENQIACIFLAIEELNIGDEIIVVSGNEYFIQIVKSIEVDSVRRDRAVKGEAVAIGMDKKILKSTNLYIR